MDYAAVESLRERHPAWRMLCANHAPLLLSFLGRFFVDEGHGASPEGQLIDALDDQLYQLNSEDPDNPRYRRPAADYLADWAGPEAGYLRRFYPLGTDEIHYDATPALEKAYAWVQSLAEPLGYAGDWPRLLAAYRWLDAARGTGRYLRQIDAPGVDTKFVESNRAVLADLLGVSRQAGPFLTELGLATRPEYVRIRLAAQVAAAGAAAAGAATGAATDAATGAAPGVGRDTAISGLSELTVRADQLDALGISFTTAVVVENEITYLTLPVPADGVVVWGRGFDVARLGRWPALTRARVHYWGDLDTHGFAILHRLRTHLPQVRSFLMDAETLSAHRERWGSEAAPTSAGLDRLAAAEAAVYDDLVSDRHGRRVRLEQERIDWKWVTEHLPYEVE